MKEIQNVNTPKIVLTGSPAELTFEVANALKTRGTKPVTVLEFNSNPISTDKIQLVCSFFDLTFEFSGADGVDPLLLDAPTGTDIDKNVDFIKNAIERHPLVAANFKLMKVPTSFPLLGGVMAFIPNGFGEAYEITDGAATTITFGSLSVFPTVSANEEFYAAQELTLELVDAEYDNLKYEAFAAGVINSDNGMMTVSFYDVPEVLHGLLWNEIPNEVTQPYFNPALREYKANVWRMSEDAYSPMLENPIQLIALKGGLPVANHSTDVTMTGQNYLGPGTRKFLTHQAREKLITKEQPEWLCFYFEEAGTYRTRLQVVYDDGTSGTINSKLVTIPEKGLWYLPSGYNQMGLEAIVPSGKTMLSYTFAVQLNVSPFTVISEVFSYVIDTRYQRHHRYFAFVNSLGGVDTIRAFGELEPGSTFTRQTTEKALSSTDRAAQGVVSMVMNERAHTFTLNTGFFQTQAEADYYNELLLSTLVVEVNELGLRGISAHADITPMRNCIVVQGDDKLPADNDFLFGKSIKMKYATNDTRWSNIAETVEKYYDTKVIVVIVIDDNSFTSNLTLSIAINAGAFVECKVNGEIKNLVSGFDYPSAGTYTVVINGYLLTELSISTDGDAHPLYIKELRSRSLTKLEFVNFTTMSGSWLYQHHPWRFIEILTFDGFDAEVNEQLIIFASQLYEKYEKLATVSIDQSAIAYGALGLQAEQYLTAEGVTVNT